MTKNDVKKLLWHLVLQIPEEQLNARIDLPRLMAATDWIDNARPPAKPRKAANKE